MCFLWVVWLNLGWGSSKHSPRNVTFRLGLNYSPNIFLIFSGLWITDGCPYIFTPPLWDFSSTPLYRKTPHSLKQLKKTATENARRGLTGSCRMESKILVIKIQVSRWNLHSDIIQERRAACLLNDQNQSILPLATDISNHRSWMKSFFILSLWFGHTTRSYLQSAGF